MPALGRVELASLNTLRLPATASRAWRFDGVAELAALGRFLNAAKAEGHAGPVVLGAGSNLLLGRDLPEPVVLVRSAGRRAVEDDGERVVIELAAGENWDAAVRWSLDQGLCGLENLALIPGTAGAAPWQNIGAYGVELAESVVSVDAWHLQEHRLASFGRSACGFGYRDSVFKQATEDTWLIVAVRLALHRHRAPRIDYGEIRDELAGTAAATTIGAADVTAARAVADAVTRIRRRKLPDPSVLGNVGSFFKNPVVDAAAAERLRLATAPHDRRPLPLYPAGKDRWKASAAWLIEACGLKGHRDGDAAVSPDHALVLVNHGQATAAQMLALAGRIQQAVQQRFGVRLEPEPRVIA